MMKSHKQTMKPFYIRPSHDRILRTLLAYYIMTAVQVRDKLYGRGQSERGKGKGYGSLNWVSKVLATLCEEKYLHRDRVSFLHPFFYTLDRKGWLWLRDQSLVPDGRFRYAREIRKANFSPDHTLACNSLSILFDRAAREVPTISALSYLTDYQTRQHTAKVKDVLGKRGETLKVAPDGFVYVRTQETDLCFVLEVDRNRHHRSAIQEKCRAYLPYNNGPFQQDFGLEANRPLLVLYAVVEGGEKRVENLLKWSETELDRLGAKDYSELFRFGVVDLEKIEPKDLLYAPIWIKPFSQAPEPLIRR